MMSYALIDSLVQAIGRCADKCNFDLGRRAVVACSGGKDSTALLFLLHHLGVEVHPAIVDLGYEGFDAAAVADELATYGFLPEVLVPPPTHDRKFLANMALLRNPDVKSPCGPCSQAKRHILIDCAIRSQAAWIAMGHHCDDLVSTLLKDYFVQRYYDKHGRYEYERFVSFVQEEQLDLVALQGMVAQKLAGTMAIQVTLDCDLCLFRPMAFISERAIEQLVQSLGVQTHGSGCSHDVFRNPDAMLSKREIVHKEYRRRGLDLSVGSALLDIALSSLDSSGRLRFNPRKLRSINCPYFDG
jgi:tRNA(Ile)-lysidine synthase TilS/MesJ